MKKMKGGSRNPMSTDAMTPPDGMIDAPNTTGKGKAGISEVTNAKRHHPMKGKEPTFGKYPTGSGRSEM